MITDRASSSGHGELLRQSLAAINSLEAEVARLEHELEATRAADLDEPIALIGAACRFPGGVTDLDSYWHLLENGVDAVTAVTPERRALGGWKSGDRWHAGLLDNIDQFDARFFGISAREANTMDPQQRLVLEVGWQALEDSGHAPGALAGSSTGVFIGLTTSDYGQLIQNGGCPPDVYIATGNAHNATAGRLSFVLGLQGPSIAVDTACSSSLVAVHLACLSLRARNCRMALAGGVNVLLSEQLFEYFYAWGMMSPGGKCKPFDASADGFVRSEGCGMVVLKRLSDALADGDRIRAIIRGSAVNQDGRSSGLTVPNGPAQEAVIRQALTSAGVEPADIGYVESHGTGTSLGDPIEAQALAAVLGAGRNAENPLLIGSVKANLGHTESAAGIAGLLKAVLSLERERIPGQIHFRQINPKIDWAGMPVAIPVQIHDWPRGSRRRLAGVSSFGFSGTNAHLILEEAPVEKEAAANLERPLHVVTLSGRTVEAYAHVATDLAACLARTPASLPNVAYTLGVGRTHFRERGAIIVRDMSELQQKLAAGKVLRRAVGHVRGKLAFLFTGQGSQWTGMCRDLYDTHPVFRDALDECAQKLPLERPLIDVIYGSQGALLDQTAYTQPALFAVEWSLAQLWKSWGIEPDVVLGHSVGEYVALCVAGVWTLSDGLRIITERARLMQLLGPGWGMTAVQTGPEKIEDILHGFDISIAARNASASTVVSGRLQELAVVEKLMAAAGIKSVRLAVSHGFHSSQMDQAAENFSRFLGSMETHEPQCRIVSSVTGAFTDRAELGQAEYWRRQVRHAVEFHAGIMTLAGAGYDLFLEIGPAPVLCGLGRQSIGAEGQLWAPSVRRERGAWEQILESLAQLYVAGADVDWRGFDAPYFRRSVSLPTYPFEREQYWFVPSPSPAPKPDTAAHPLLGSRFAVAGTLETYIWENELSTTTLPYLEDHCVQGEIIFPATAYIEMTVAAAREIYGDLPVAVTEIEYRKPLFLTADPVRMQLSLSPSDGRVRIHARSDSSKPWTLCAQSFVKTVEQPADACPPQDFESRAEGQMSGAEFYESFQKRGNMWGPAFQGMRHAWLRHDEAWSEIEVPESIRSGIERYCVHPAVADACGHVLAALASAQATTNSGAFVGQAIDRVCIYQRPRGNRLFVHGQVVPVSNSAVVRGDVRVFDADGTLISHLQGAQMRYLDQQSAGKISEWFYRILWREALLSANPLPVVGEWLILSGQEVALADALAANMRAANLPSTVVTDHAQSQLHEVFGHAPTAGVVYLWGLDAREPAGGPAAASCEIGGLLELIRVMAKNAEGRIWIVTSGLEEVDNAVREEAVWQAPLRGLARSVAVEHSELWGGLIDLDPDASPAENADVLWHYLQSPGGEDQVAVRAGRLFAARLEHCTIPETASVVLRRDCCYLITGGLGGLGLQVARWMVGHGASRLVLMGRTPLPDRSMWSALAADHPQLSQVTAIRELESAGATVHLAHLDVSDSRAVSRYFASYKQECWPPIRGVVHAAGILEPRLLADLTPEQCERSLLPKIGAWVLDRELEDELLDFFVMFSSASALRGTPRLGAYAAANSFLDALACRRHGRGQPALSVNWGLWSEAGMALGYESNSVRELAERGVGSMTNEQGLEALARLMQQPAAQIAVLPVDWRKWAELYPSYIGSPLLTSLFEKPRERAAAGLNGQLARKPRSQPELAGYLAGALASVLGFNARQLDPDTPISNFGIDSLTALEFKHRIEADLGLAVSMVRFLQGPTLAQLSAEIEPLMRQSSDADAIVEPEDAGALLARVDDLTEAELDAALVRLLNNGVSL
jgi:acyl transferase domain-containing protein/acyl carrier protein